jgi:hypothetical protein
MNTRLRFCHVSCVVALGLLPSPKSRAAFAIPSTDTPVIVSSAQDSLPLPAAPGTRAHLYRMNYWFTAPFIVVGTAGNIYAIPRIIKAKPALTDAELAAINREAVPRFDRWVLDQKVDDYRRPDKISDYVLNGTIVAGVLLGLDKKIRQDAVRLALLYCETQVFTFCLYDFSPFGPAWQNKLRPVVYYTQYPTEDRRQGNNRNSFYGGHVANAAAASFSAAKILNDYHPEFSTATKYLLYGAATVPPLAVAYLRTRALKHFPSDNLVGMLIGGACGIIIPELHRIKKQGIEFRTEATPAGPGIGMTWRWNEQRGNK